VILKWTMAKPVIKPYAPFIRSIDTRFHYGQAIFEGMKAYKDENNDLAFRPDQNYNRFNTSAANGYA
jgi:branched-chain amino acid aminotransferase